MSSVESAKSFLPYRMRKSHRVVVTGLGGVTSLGFDMNSIFQALVEGRSGITNISNSEWEFRSEAYNSQVDLGGLVTNFDITKEPLNYVTFKEGMRISRGARFALTGAIEAMTQANFLVEPTFPLTKGGTPLVNVDPERVGVDIGTGIGGGTEIANTEDTLRDKGDKFVDNKTMLLLLPERASTVVSLFLDARAGASTTNAACASGAKAIGNAYQRIERGAVDVMITGGSEAAVHRIALAGFNNMRALSRRNFPPEKASCPFDKKADGFVPAEGSGILVLESLEHALGREATILAELVGFGETTDAFNEVFPNSSEDAIYKRGVARSILLALEMAEMDISEIDYDNLHGTSTSAGGVEIKHMKEVFGELLKKMLLSSTKSATGHLLGAAGGLEAAICVKTILEGKVPPTINLEDPIEEIDGLDLVPNLAREAVINTAMSNSFGFGGENFILIFRKYFPKYK